ncbi:MAG: KR domain-containing protein, partial [Deltaproteobacteria bacterium]|nr:KR domain-containing protein [Deltaproteobacteria bacterium]
MAEDGAVWAQRAVRGMSGPVAGVVHTAGVLGDGTLGVQDVARLRVTSGCKAEAWSLRGAAASLQAQALHVAVLFSSVAALVGYPRHADYSAANAGLDLLGRAWQAAGAPCTSVQWGVWGAVGMATRGAAASRKGRPSMDIGIMAPAVGLAALERVAVRRAREEAAVVCATRGAYWDALVAAAGSSRGVPELFRELVRGPPAAAAKAVPGRSDEAPRALQASAVQAQLRGRAGSLRGKDVAVDAPLLEQGLDSLGVVELRNAVGRELGLHLNPTAVLDYPTVAALTGHV